MLNQVQEVALSSLAFQVTIHKSRLKNNNTSKRQQILKKLVRKQHNYSSVALKHVLINF